MRFVIFIDAVVLAGCVATPAQLAAIDTQQLCVDYAETIITGQGISINGFQGASGQQLEQELARRGETCTPATAYLKLAITRLEIQQQRQALSSANIEAAAKLMNAARPMPLGPSGATGPQ